MQRKGYFFAAFLALTVCFSCNKTGTDPEFHEYRFDLSYGGSMTSELSSLKAGERVGLYLASGQTLTGKAVDESGRLVIKAGTAASIPDGTAVYPYYPYVGDCTDGGGLEVVIAPNQQGETRSLPLYGEPFTIQDARPGETNGEVCLKNAAALVDIRVCASGASAGEQVESVYLRTANNVSIAGKAKTELTRIDTGDGHSPELSFSGTAGHPYVNLTRSWTVASSADDAGAPNLLFVAPGTYSGTVTVVTGSATYSLPFSDKSFTTDNANRFVIDLNAPVITRTAHSSIENDQVAGYLDAVEKDPYKTTDYSYTYVTRFYTGTGADKRLDLPKPVTVKWTNPAVGNGAKTVYVFKDPGMMELELSVPVDDAAAVSAQIYNLIPGRTWYYRVKGAGSDVATGVFKTTGRRRMIKVGESTYGKNHANNCRDFGGQLTRDGKRIKYGKIFRGSNMDDTSPAAKQVLREYLNIGLDVDLRAQGSGERGKYQFDALSLGGMHTTETYGSWGNLSDKSRMKSTLTKIFNAVAKNTVVYIHCKVGADRTGYVCMLLEALLGVPQERCDVDYEMTSFSGAVGARTRTGVGNYYYVSKTKDGVTTVQGVDFINTFPGETFQEKAVNYVTGTLGIPRSTITAFQNQMLE